MYEIDIEVMCGVEQSGREKNKEDRRLKCRECLARSVNDLLIESLEKQIQQLNIQADALRKQYEISGLVEDRIAYEEKLNDVKAVQADIDSNNTIKNEDRAIKEDCGCVDFIDDSDYYDEVEERGGKTYSDYPQSVSNNAKRGIKLNEAVNNKCATQVGKVRARQLANREPLTMGTIKRMHSYLSRAEEYYKPNDTKACGTISYLLWGGKSAKSWAESKIKQNETK